MISIHYYFLSKLSNRFFRLGYSVFIGVNM